MRKDQSVCGAFFGDERFTCTLAPRHVGEHMTVDAIKAALTGKSVMSNSKVSEAMVSICRTLEPFTGEQRTRIMTATIILLDVEHMGVR